MEQQIKEILVEVCASTEVLEDGIDLIDSGLLDSLAFIDLLSALELLGIEIQPTQVDRNRFRTVEGICSLVREFQKMS